MGKTIGEVAMNNVVAASPGLSARRRHGRAVNAVADFLRSQLRVPNIYIDPRGSGLYRVDVLAADAAGSGDIHAVEVKLLKPTVTVAMRLNVQIAKSLPAHYKYLAIPRNSTNLSADLGLFASNGIGRLGILLISESQGHFPTVEWGVKPERFRLANDELEQVERFLGRAKPDIYVRV